MKTLIIGGPGTISAGTLDELPQKGMETAVFTRSREQKLIPKNVKCYWGDRNNESELRSCINDFRPDVVIDTICFRKEQAQALHELIKETVQHLVFVSTVVVYGASNQRLPVREDDPGRISEDNEYGYHKLLCERFYFDRHTVAGFPVTIVRPAYSFGPKVIIGMFSEGYNFLRRLRDCRPVAVPSSGQTLLHACPGRDVGRMIARIVLEPRAIGTAYNLAYESYLTHDSYVNAFATAFSRAADIIHIPQDIIEQSGNADAKIMLHRHKVFLSSVFSIEKFTRDYPDFRWTPFAEAAVETVRACDHAGLLDGAAPHTFEDDMIAAWRKATGGLRF